MLMLQSDKVKEALAAVEACCGHCEVCSPDCPVFIARRALQGLLDDLLAYEQQEQQEQQDDAQA